MIPVQCPNCGSQFTTDDANAGRAARCPNCGSGIQVPVPQQPVAPAPAAQQFPATIVVQAPVAPAVPVPPQPAEPGHGGLAVAGMICGIVALAVAFIPCLWLLAILTAITGAVLSGIALGTAGKAKRKKGVAVAGLVCSIVTLIWIPIYLFAIIQTFTRSFWWL